MTKDEALKLALEALENNRQTHHYCEDTWYSCPKHEDGCANESEGDECNCGADKANAEIDQAITSLRQAIEQAQQAEPDYYGLTKDHLWMSITKDHHDRLKPEFRMACYTSPPPRQPLTWEKVLEIGLECANDDSRLPYEVKVARAIEAAHGIKGEA